MKLHHVFGALAIAGLTAVLPLAACSKSETIAAFPEAYAGVGVELTMEAAGARVVHVAPGGAAAKAGLVENDIVLAVDGKQARGEQLADIVQALRGKPGTNVEILARTAKGERTLTLERVAVARSKDGGYDSK
jgi:C-terminal processing protease CtpA/Prc